MSLPSAWLKKFIALASCFVVAGFAFSQPSNGQAAHSESHQHVGWIPLAFLERSLYSSAFTVEQVQALAYIPFEMYANNYSIYITFFGFFGLALGYLVFRSTFVPRAMGVLMAFGGLAYLFSSFANFLAPAFAASLFPLIALPSLIGEGSLCLWFLLIGLNTQRWREQASLGATI